MEKDRIITALAGAKWLSDIPELGNRIPANCILNKSVTGCGATELALRNDVPTIIAVPTQNLVNNKASQHVEDVIGVLEGVPNEAIKTYAQSHSPIKIITTYDSVPRVTQTLLDCDIDVYNEVFLFVDEYHLLFNAYSYRHEAIQSLLDTASRFKRVTYVSATPIERQYIMRELQNLPMLTVRFQNVEPTKIRFRQTNRPQNLIVKLCRNAIGNHVNYNLHFFVNSVDFIARVIKNAKLTPDDVKVVCSTSGEAKYKNQVKIGRGYPIAQPLDPVKKINFYTSTAFEGCDIFDPVGKTYIVSDGRRAHTLIDISTLFIQICGRIRDSIYKYDITHIFSTTRYKTEISFEEFESATLQRLKEAETLVKEFKNMSLTSRKMLLKDLFLNDKYIRVVNDELVVDRNMANIDIVNFKLSRLIYASDERIAQEHQKNHLDIIVSTYTELPSEKLEDNANAKLAFKDLFDEYHKIELERMETMYSFGMFRQAVLTNSNPLVKKAYDILGYDKVVALKYNQTAIKREIAKHIGQDKENIILSSLNEMFPQYTAIPSNRLKQGLQKIYDDLGIQLTAKATDLQRWYTLKRCYRSFNGKNVQCYILVRENMVSSES